MLCLELPEPSKATPVGHETYGNFYKLKYSGLYLTRDLAKAFLPLLDSFMFRLLKRQVFHLIFMQLACSAFEQTEVLFAVFNEAHFKCNEERN